VSREQDFIDRVDEMAAKFGWLDIAINNAVRAIAGLFNGPNGLIWSLET
jgi:NAD(P)-dependent dehydrogenase (short-subunit alcohol dehydrogenase family)